MAKLKNDELKVVNIRLVESPPLYSDKPIATPDDAVKTTANELKNHDREVFAILNLKTNGKPINLNICSVGTLNASIINPREVFKSAILSNAASFIAIHNHPSGNINPSREDKMVTKRLMECGRLLDIQMLDHIIVGGETGETFSFKREGLFHILEIQGKSYGEMKSKESPSDFTGRKEFTEKDILKLLSQVNAKLEERGQSASILLSGGASMSLMFNRDRLTQDVDAVLLSSNREEFRHLIAEVGAENGLEEDWLNDAVKGFIDFSWQKEFVPTGLSNLTVYSVPADKLLAMKLNAGRTFSKDKEDAIELMNHLKLQSVDEAIDILENSLPGNVLTARTKFFTMETFDEYKRLKERENSMDSLKEVLGKLKETLEVEKTFNIEVTEIFQKVVQVQATSLKEAERMVTKRYRAGDIVLTPDDFVEEQIGAYSDKRAVEKAVTVDKLKDLGKTEQSQAAEGKTKTNENKLYITLPQGLCRQMDSKIKSGEKFNTMIIPKGTVLNGKDIGNALIHPLFMNESKSNSNMMYAAYYPDKMKDSKINLLYPNGTIERVELKELKEAIDTRQAEWKAELQEKQKQHDKQQEVEKTKEKDDETEL